MNEHSPARRSSGPDPHDQPASEAMSPAAADRLERLRTLKPSQIALAIGGAVIVTTVLVVSIGRLAGFTKLGETLSGATWGWLGLCALGQIGVFVGYAGAFRASVAGSGDLLAEQAGPPDSGTAGRLEAGSRRGPRVGIWHSIKVALAGFGLTQIVAAGGAAGMAFTFWVMRRLGFSKKNAMVQLITLNTAVYFVFGLLGWLGALAGLLDPALPKAMAVSWLAAFAAVIALARWFTQPHRASAFDATEDASRFRRALAVGVTAAARVRAGMRSTDGRRLLAWSLLYWAGDLVSLWAAVRAFGVTVSVGAIVVAYVLGYLAQSVPIPLIATGGVDAATTFTLAAVGVPIEVALLGVVAHRVFAFWLPVIPGLWSATVLVRGEIPASGRRGRLLRGVIGRRK